MEKTFSSGQIVKIAGPLVVASDMRDVELFDVVSVGQSSLIGEVIEVHGDLASVQVYEETAGLKPGEPVQSKGHPLSVELAPGMIGHIFDGIQRPLVKMVEVSGSNIERGVAFDALDRDNLWHFKPRVQAGDTLLAGDILGVVEETSIVEHRVMVPANIKGEVKLKEIFEGEFTIEDTIAILEQEGEEILVQMLQSWPVRIPRPHAGKTSPTEPMVTGQRVIDMLFPISRGGTAAVPGPFGSGKTVIQHQLAKWADSDIVVYIGCGERGNEMTDVLNEFPDLIDPRTGKSMMERTILIANTSDMPVAAREASIYTGITIAEYFRDMGYAVSVMADSTSRWAEALREMSGRLEEMPGEEGYPAYLGSRMAQFYERAGAVTALGQEKRKGYLTAIGAVSPPGGDMSDPVVQATLRIVKVFWRLDSDLAYKRHFPAINWLESYSLYEDQVNEWQNTNVHHAWSKRREEAMLLLAEQSALEEIVRLVGQDTLSTEDKIKMEAARSLTDDFLHQNSFDEIDTFTPLEKQFYLLDLILTYYDEASKAAKAGVPARALLNLNVMAAVGRYKYTEMEDAKQRYEEIKDEINKEISKQIK